MQVIVSGRHVEVTDALRRLLHEQFSRLERFEPRIQRVEATLREEKNRCVVEARLSVDRARPIHARADGSEFRTAVDRVADKLARQLKKSRGRRLDRKTGGRGTEPERGDGAGETDLELDRTA